METGMNLGQMMKAIVPSDRVVVINAAGQVIYRGFAANFEHTGISDGRISDHEKKKYPEYSVETLAIVSLLHDLCKMDAYTKQEDGTYRASRKFPAGHGEKSVFIILPFMELSEEEILAIRWHMGAYDFCAKGGSYDLNNTFNQSRLAVMLHIADMEATHFDEREEDRQ